MLLSKALSSTGKYSNHCSRTGTLGAKIYRQGRSSYHCQRAVHPKENSLKLPSLCMPPLVNNHVEIPYESSHRPRVPGNLGTDAARLDGCLGQAREPAEKDEPSILGTRQAAVWSPLSALILVDEHLCHGLASGIPRQARARWVRQV